MSWNDSFGDALSVQEVLERVEPFIGIVASERHDPRVPREDVMQEARIAVWQAIRKQPTDLRTYLIAAIKTRTNGVIARQNWTGAPSRQGRPDRDPLDVAEDIESAVLLAGADLLDAVLDAYHHGQVWTALDALPKAHREYVYMRFWLGMTNREIGALKGTSMAVENALWNRTIRPVLARELAHLR